VAGVSGSVFRGAARPIAKRRRQRGCVDGGCRWESTVWWKENTIDGNVEGYLDWLKVIHPGAHGNSDLSAHFFRRASKLLGEHGAFGLIATNTIAQGDTRNTALVPLVAEGWTIFDATSTLPWPGAAAVTVSLVHAAHGRTTSVVQPRLDGLPAIVVNSRLRSLPERSDAISLHSNDSAAYVGTYVLGAGFTLNPQELDVLVQEDQRTPSAYFPIWAGKHQYQSQRRSLNGTSSVLAR